MKHSKYVWLWPALALFLPACPAAGQNYVLRTTSSRQQQVLRVYDSQTLRLIWTRTCAHLFDTAWSKDHGSLVAAFQDTSLWNGRYQFRLLVWRGGEPVRLIQHPRLFQDADGISEFRWTRDGQHVLFRAVGSGDLDTHQGQLWELNAGTGTLAEGPYHVRRYQEAGLGKVHYQLVGIQEQHRGSRIVTPFRERTWHLWRY